MQMVGAVENEPERIWYRCTRCRHASLININELKKTQENAKKRPDRADCSEYKPENTYQVGQAIFHTDWDDVGKIVSKETTSGGAHAIVVSFERLGERRLLEGVANSVADEQV
jgi:hypothetical protein